MEQVRVAMSFFEFLKLPLVFTDDDWIVDMRHGLIVPLITRIRIIHRSAWKRDSRKFIYRILHNLGPIGLETADRPGRVPNPKPYILWWCIKMR